MYRRRLSPAGKPAKGLNVFLEILFRVMKVGSLLLEKAIRLPPGLEAKNPPDLSGGENPGTIGICDQRFQGLAWNIF